MIISSIDVHQSCSFPSEFIQRNNMYATNFSEKNIDIRNDRLPTNYDVIVSLHNFYKLKLKDYISMQNSKDWFEKFKFQKIF